MFEVYWTDKKNGYWSLHDLIMKLSDHMKDIFNSKIHVEEHNRTYSKRFDYYLPDCEIIIYDAENDILRALSFAEHRTKLWDIFMKRNNSYDILINTHNLSWGISSYKNVDIKFQHLFGSFYPFLPNIDYDYFYNRRKLIDHENLLNKMFIRTTTGRGDEKSLYKSELVNDKFRPLPFESYLIKALNHKIGLSISGVSELCHREFDYMAIGLPVMRLEYIGEYYPEIIPNYHYISIDRGDLPKDSIRDCHGGSEYVKKYIDKFNEVKDDKDLLDFISANGKEYISKNCSSENRLKLTLSRLKLENVKN